MNIFVDYKKNVWLSYDYLKGNGILEKAIEHWKERRIGRYTYISERVFINYNSIPEPSRQKLPAKLFLIQDAGDEAQERRQTYYYNELKEAFDSMNVADWRNKILDISDRFTNERLLEFSQKAAVYEKILRIYHGRKGDLTPLHKAFLQLFPESYSKRNRFCMALKQAKETGILSVAINYACLNNPEEKYTDEHKYYALYMLCHGNHYDITSAYRKFVNSCEDAEIKTPSYKWFWEFRNKNLNDIESGGKINWEAVNRNYATIIPALYAGDQWQIDGWRIPVYCKKLNEKGNIERFVTYNLFAVLDAHSRKIIGYNIAERENTETILKALEMACKKTLTLPYEIVSDNHSFNKTKEAGNLKDDFMSMGGHWTVDSNPRRKSILERAFKTLGEKHFKEHYGYIGQGIKTKVKNGLTSPELMDKYTKTENMLTYEQIVSISYCVVNEYNNTIISKLNETPENRYQKSERPHAIRVDDSLRMKLFIRKTEHKISHGQITIRRGEHKYEYQLPAKYSGKYNNKTVGVRYANFDEIYLYELNTDKSICSVLQKVAIHGALANQTQQDREYLLKNAGRMKGIETQKRKRKEEIFKGANSDNYDAYIRVNQITTNKDVIESLRNNPQAKQELKEFQNIDIEYVQSLPVVDAMLDTSLKPKKEKENRYLWRTDDSPMDKIKIVI